MEHTAEKLAKYDLMKISIQSYLNSYYEMVLEMEQELKDYIKGDYSTSIIQLKENQIHKIKGKIEILTELNKK